MGISVMVDGWNECSDIAVNAPNVSMSASSMAQVLRAAGFDNLDCQGGGFPAGKVGEVADHLQAIEHQLSENVELRTRVVNVWSVLAFAKSRQRGVYWA